MLLETMVNERLARYPAIKKVVKRAYQKGMCVVSKHTDCTGNIIRLSPEDCEHEYFFGYYDKSPWDATNRYVLCMRAKNTWSDVSPKEPADILLIDTTREGNDPKRIRVIGETSAWNVQQGCMLQWLGPDFTNKVLYNDCREGKYCSVVLELDTGVEEVIPSPVYTVSADGSFALTLDFSRLYNLRPGYGYYNIPEKTAGECLPDAPAIWYVDLRRKAVRPLLSYRDFAEFEPRPEMQGPGIIHKVNHLMLNPSGDRFMVLHRWFVGQRKYTRLVTCGTDGKDMYNLSDDDMVSHCFWKNDREILAFERKAKSGNGYYLMEDRSQNYRRLWPELSGDGHPSYSPDGSMVVTDSYPNRNRMAEVRVMKGELVFPLAQVFAPFKYDNDTRCDLHPRWSRDGSMICFDAVYEGHRGLYAVNVPKLEFSRSEQFTGDKTVVYLMTSCKSRGPTNQTLNIIKNLPKDKYRPILLNLYRETPGDSVLERFLPEVANYICLKSSVKKMLLGGTRRVLSPALSKLDPYVVHSVGLFPSLFMLRQGVPHCTTVRTNIFFDYRMKYGPIKGTILENLNLFAIKKADCAVACSKSLADFYQSKLLTPFSYIRNGVDTERFCPPCGSKAEVRRKIHLQSKIRTCIYTGSFVMSKDQEFAIRNFLACSDDNTVLLLLGDGPTLQNLREKYGAHPRVLFMGHVTHPEEYLQAADLFLSTSRLEGMPNGVLEAIACGLPVLLSDIPQHLELLEAEPDVGVSYRLNDDEDFRMRLRSLLKTDLSNWGERCRAAAIRSFSAEAMSRQYQEIYDQLGKESRNG